MLLITQEDKYGSLGSA